MQGHIWCNASETKWDTHQWTLEDEDKTCERNAMDPREARGSACRSTKNARMRNMRKCETREICECMNYELCGIARHAQYVRCVKTRGIWNVKYVRCAEMWNAQYMRKCEMHKNAKCAKTRNTWNAKIVKVAALQQVQHKVLLYGLYAPIETWVSTPASLFFRKGDTIQKYSVNTTSVFQEGRHDPATLSQVHSVQKNSRNQVGII